MAGLEKIKIPLKAKGLTIEQIEPYLRTIISVFRANSQKIESDFNTYLLQHEILNKTRLHDDALTNNIVFQPHISAMVDFKCGYSVGNPIKYAQSKEKDTDDIQYLNKYIRATKKRTIDKNVALWAYATGVGYYYIKPSNLENENSPFELLHIPSTDCAKVYSSYLGGEELFDIIRSKFERIDSKGVKKTIEIYDIFLQDYMYEYETIFSQIKPTFIEKYARGLYRKLPLVEKKFNPNYISIVDLSKNAQDALDRLISDGVDNIDDIVNQIFVYNNVALGDTPEEASVNHKSMLKNGAIVLSSDIETLPSSLTTLKNDLNLDNVTILYQIVKQEMYDCIGVPLPSMGISSGNVTKGGGEVANGWDNAYNKLLNDINSFMDGDIDLLDRILDICKKSPNCKINDLTVSDIEIRYNPNLSDNILTKSQAFVNFIENGVPPKMALEKCKLSSDPEAEGIMIEEYYNKLKQGNNTINKTIIRE